MAFDYEKYLRLPKFPHIWCAGCGNGNIMKALLRAIDRTGWKKDEIVMVSGIGCSSRTPGYLDFHTLHTAHGRAIPFATGVKLARPELQVIVVTGDGDCAAIGGNHFIHAARRNIDITVIVFNNHIYGMTGGQVSPSTPSGMKGTTAPYGMGELPFDICRLAIGAGASYVARGTVYHQTQLTRFIGGGFKKHGFAVIEVITNCHTNFGRRNRMSSASGLVTWIKDHSVPTAEAAKMTPAEREGKFVTGLLHEEDRPELTDSYRDLFLKLQATEQGEAKHAG